jgi:hypothetical protein
MSEKSLGRQRKGLEGLALARAWGFESPLSHQLLTGKCGDYRLVALWGLLVSQATRVASHVDRLTGRAWWRARRTNRRLLDLTARDRA